MSEDLLTYYFHSLKMQCTVYNSYYAWFWSQTVTELRVQTSVINNVLSTFSFCQCKLETIYWKSRLLVIKSTGTRVQI